MRRRLLAGAAAAALGFGVAAEWVAFGLGDVRHWLPDVAVGWVFVAGGLLAAWRRPESRSGALLVLTGWVWFAGNFASVGWAAVAWLALHATYLHRGVFVHCVLSYPSGRLSSRLDGAAVGAAYAASAIVPLARAEAATIAFAAGFVGVAVHGYRGARGPARRARVPAVRAAALVGCVLAAGAGARLAFPAGDANELVLLAYQAALCVAGAVLVGGLVRRPDRDAAVADLVVELEAGRSATLRDGLARALGDPTLTVGYWVPAAGGYVDAMGRPFALPEPGAGRATTVIERDGEPVVALVHDPAVLDDPALLEGVAAAARLAAVNARLTVAVRGQLEALRSSRRRLVEVGDEERRHLEERLRAGAERRLLQLSETLARASAERSGAGPSLERLARAEEQLARTLGELRQLAGGLHPRELADEGLAAAVGSLAARCPVPVDIALPEQRLAPDVEAALYFVCAEALANIVKHASARAATIALRRNGGRIVLEIADDGAGGANLGAGSGLRGLADRVEALGGTLRLDSPPGRGTRVSAEIPLDAS